MNRADRVILFVLRLLVVLGTTAALVLVLIVGVLLLSEVAPAAEPDQVLLIVDGEGNTLMRCKLPTAYLLPPAKALICDQLPVHHDGFEP